MHVTDKESGAFTKRPFQITLIIVALSIISFITSFDGAISLAGISDSENNWSINIFLGFIVLMIQSLLIIALFYFFNFFNLFDVRSWIPSLIWLFMYFSAMLISVFFSYSFYYSLFRAEDFAKHNFTVQLSKVNYSFHNFRQEFDSVHQSILDLVDYSQKQAKKERTIGGTCNSIIGAGNGPRRYFRDREAKIFREFVPSVNKLKEKIHRNILTIHQEIKKYNVNDILALQNKINNQITQVNLYRKDVVFRNIRETIKKHTGNSRLNIYSIDPRSNSLEKINCPDQHFDNKANSILQSIKALNKIPPVTFFNPKEEKQNFKRTFSVFVESPYILTGIKKYDDSNVEDGIEKGDLMPLIIGIIVDMFIFLVELANKLTYKDKSINKNFKGVYYSVNDIKVIEEKLLQGNGYFSKGFYLLRKYQLNQFAKIFVIPVEHDKLSKNERQIIDLLEIWTAFGQAKLYATGISPKFLPKKFKKDFGADISFNLYKIPKAAWKEFIKASYVYMTKNST
jgi:hypothetical protein